jgi:hypothetical protein
MIRKFLYLSGILLMGLFWVSCESHYSKTADSDEIVIYGRLTGGKEASLKLEEMLATNTELIQEVTLDKNDRFYFKIKAEEFKVLYLKTQLGLFVTLLANPGESIEISGSYAQLSQTYAVKGSEGTQKLQYINESKKPYMRQLDSLGIIWENKKYDENKLEIRNELDSQVVEIIKVYQHQMMDFIHENDSSLLGIFAYYQSFGQRKVFDDKKDTAVFRRIVNSLIGKYPDNFHAIENYRRLLKTKHELQGVNFGVQPGMTIPNILIRNTNEEGSFPSDFYGRTILYCFSDQQEISKGKLLKEVDDKYRTSGFRIIHISNELTEGQNNIDFIHLQGTVAADEKPVKEIFGQDNLPFYVLVNRDGIIQVIETELEDVVLTLESMFS